MTEEQSQLIHEHWVAMSSAQAKSLKPNKLLDEYQANLFKTLKETGALDRIYSERPV